MFDIAVGPFDASDAHLDAHLDLNHVPYVLYVVKYIDPVPLAPFPGVKNNDVKECFSLHLNEVYVSL